MDSRITCESETQRWSAKRKAVISSPLFSHPWWVTKLSSMEELGGHLSRVSLDELKKDNGEVSLASVGLFFPREIFFEILSWLPVKYLVRCKCVCKQWYKLVEDRSFIMKHFSRSEPVIVYFEDKVENLDVDGTIVREKFRIIDVFAGVILEKFPYHPGVDVICRPITASHIRFPIHDSALIFIFSDCIQYAPY